MKIAFFCAPTLQNSAGAEMYMINVAKLLKKNNPNNEIEIVTLSSHTTALLSRLINIYHNLNFFKDIKFTHTRQQVNSLIHPISWKELSLGELRTLNNYDIIYTKNEILDLLFLNFAKITKKTKVIVGVHTPIYYPYPENTIGKIHNLIYSSKLYKLLIHRTWQIHLSNSEGLLLFKDRKIIQFPYPYEFQLKELKNHKIKNVAFTGRICVQKGVRVLVNTLEAIAPQFPLINFYIYGSGDESLENKLIDLSKKYKNITYSGHISRQNVIKTLKKIDLLLAPSLWEVLPFSVLEAQSLGIPVISFNIPGPKNIIVNQKTGILVDNENDYTKTTQNILQRGYFNYNKKSYVSQQKLFNPKRINNEILKMFQVA